MTYRDNNLILDDLVINDINVEPINLNLTQEQEDMLNNGKMIRLDDGSIMWRIKGKVAQAESEKV